MKIYKTRCDEMGYTNLTKGLWRFVSLQDKPAVVGPMYHSRIELLSDLDRYLKEWGYDV